jgi:hypothetical protein
MVAGARGESESGGERRGDWRAHASARGGAVGLRLPRRAPPPLNPRRRARPRAAPRAPPPTLASRSLPLAVTKALSFSAISRASGGCSSASARRPELAWRRVTVSGNLAGAARARAHAGEALR